MTMTFTFRQQRFIEAYAGNATEAAIAAGYSPRSARVQGQRLVRQPGIAAAIRKREEHVIKRLIASREQRQEFWTRIMHDEDEDIKVRIKASELLARSEGDFLERVKDNPIAEPLPPAQVMRALMQQKEQAD